MILNFLSTLTRSRKKQKVLFWSNLHIPAKLFFHNLGEEDLSYLTISGNPTEEELENAYDTIYDEYYQKKDNRKAKIVLKTKNRIVVLTGKIAICKNIIQFACIAPLDNNTRKIVLDRLKKYKIKFDHTKDLRDEVLRVMKMQIPAWETNLKLEQDNLEKLNKGEITSFEKNIELMSDSKGYPYPEDVSLLRYLEAEKLIEEKVRRQKAEDNKRKRRGQ